MVSFIKSFRYLSPFIIYFFAYLAFTRTGIYCFIPLLFVFFLVPIIELFIEPNSKNLMETEEVVAKENKLYDFILWLTAPLQYVFLYIFLQSFTGPLQLLDIIGRIIAMGLLCGGFGINVAHELGHRVNKTEQFFAKSLLLTSLYMHFFIEHNKGHHKHVATPNDPSTAKYKQSLYSFWLQTFQGTYVKAWQIAIEDAQKRKSKFPILLNEMALFQLIQIGFCFVIYFNFGLVIFSHFLVSAFIGAALLETVNYIEHYGLQRQQRTDLTYERVLPAHSWNSNHVIGRLIFFELSRHSDHHYMASRKYQILRHMDEAPQMPTGYPGMILLALVPPIWFQVMDKQMKKYSILTSNL